MTNKGNEAARAVALGEDEIAAVSGGSGFLGSGTRQEDGGTLGSGGGRDGGGTIGSGT